MYSSPVTVRVWPSWHSLSCASRRDGAADAVVSPLATAEKGELPLRLPFFVQRLCRPSPLREIKPLFPARALNGAPSSSAATAKTATLTVTGVRQTTQHAIVDERTIPVWAPCAGTKSRCIASSRKKCSVASAMNRPLARHATFRTRQVSGTSRFGTCGCGMSPAAGDGERAGHSTVWNSISCTD